SSGCIGCGRAVAMGDESDMVAFSHGHARLIAPPNARRERSGEPAGSLSPAVPKPYSTHAAHAKGIPLFYLTAACHCPLAGRAHRIESRSSAIRPANLREPPHVHQVRLPLVSFRVVRSARLRRQSDEMPRV